MRILQHPLPRQGGATVAQVTYSDREGFGAVSTAARRGVPLFAPRGIAYRPCEGDNLLLVEADGADVCAGVLSVAQDLEAGELRLSSSGGASLHLKCNGDIVLNGVVITKEGELKVPSNHQGGE